MPQIKPGRRARTRLETHFAVPPIQTEVARRLPWAFSLVVIVAQGDAGSSRTARRSGDDGATAG
jgi:hypothetical protein